LFVSATILVNKAEYIKLGESNQWRVIGLRYRLLQELLASCRILQAASHIQHLLSSIKSMWHAITVTDSIVLSAAAAAASAI